MKKTYLIVGIVVLCLVLVVSLSLNYKKSCDSSWKDIFGSDEGYLQSYNQQPGVQKSFFGVISYDSAGCQTGTLMRCTPYKLDGTSVYTGSKNLEEYKGYGVEIIGKEVSGNLEGQQLEEIWPIKIRCT